MIALLFYSSLDFLAFQVLVATDMPGMLKKLIDSNSILEKVNQGINSYLEKKRLYFPRCAISFQVPGVLCLK